jgi:hypothetical protein
MKSVVADALYWIATVQKKDQWKDAAKAAKTSLGPVLLVTTDGACKRYCVS